MARRPTRAERSLLGAGVPVGLLLSATLFLFPATSSGVGPGADVVFAVAPTGELALSRSGPFVQANGLRPPRRAAGTVTVTNASTLAVRLRAQGRTGELDDVLRVEVDVAGHRLFRGPLAALAEWSPRFVLDTGETAPLAVRAWVGPDAGGEYVGRVEAVDLELASEAVAR